MASQAASPAAVLHSAQVVGNAFVEQYYHILHQSPELVHKFYQDSSILSRPDTNGFMSSVTTMQAIDEKIQSLDYKNIKAEIQTADAQDSHQSGVIVLVTGCLTGKDNVKRKFAQTFFLAPQEKGYFVQNDVFRFVEETAPLGTTSTPVENIVDSAPADLAAPNSEATRVTVNNLTHDSTTTLAAEDVNNVSEVCDPEVNEGSGLGLKEEVVEEPLPVQTSPNETGLLQKPDASATQEEKKSYASIVRVPKNIGSSGSGHVQGSSLRWAPANTDQLKSRTAKPSPEPEPSVPVVVNVPESSKVHEDGHSVYVRNLPMNTTVAQLEEEFKRFGPIKSNGVQVRSHKLQGFCFGFVEFESLESMHSAIKAPSITIGNRQVVVEEKRTTARVGGGGGGRGRYPSGRGGGFRGRGNYFGGRGFGRNEFRYQGEFSNRSRGPMGRNTEVYQRVDQNGGGRLNHQPNKETESGQ